MGTMIESGAETRRVLEGSQIGLCVDTGHLAAAGSDPGEIVAADPDRVRHVHLKDVDSELAARVVEGSLTFTDAVREGLFVPLGTGNVDVSGIVDTLEGAGYQGWYVLEQDVMLPGEPEGDGPVADVRACLTYLTGSSMSTVTTTIQHWISGQPTGAGSTRTASVYNPASGQVAAEVLLAESADVDSAIDAAWDAFPGWSQTSVSARTEIMFAFRELLNANAERLAEVITDEHGKVLSDALGEVQRGLEVVEFACRSRACSRASTRPGSSGVDTFSFREPLGVVAGITPFNFPAMVPMWMFPVAIACGNTFVLKPSEQDPSASLLIAELWPRPGCRTASSTSCTGQGRGGCAARLTQGRRGVLRRLDAGRALRPRARQRQRQAGPGARRREEPRDRDARRRHRLRRRPPVRGGVRLGGGAVHGDLGGGRRRLGADAVVDAVSTGPEP